MANILYIKTLSTLSHLSSLRALRTLRDKNNLHHVAAPLREIEHFCLLANRYGLVNQADNVRNRKVEQSKAGNDRRVHEAEGYLKFFAPLFFKKAGRTSCER